MNSIEFGKKCQPYNIQYRDIFGYVPCRGVYNCNQDEYFSALLKAIETKREISEFIPVKNSKQYEGRRYHLEYPADIFILSDEFYEAKINGITFKIEKEKFNNETVVYAYRISEIYESKKEKISKFVLHRIGDFYSFGYTPEEIKEKLGEPYIEILDKDFGVIVWVESTLDEHIVDCEFGEDNMTLYHVSVNG